MLFAYWHIQEKLRQPPSGQQQGMRSIAAAEGGALWTGGYVPLDERKSWERIRGGPFLPAPDSLTGPEHGLVKCCDFKTTCNGSRQLSIEHSSPDRWGTAALDSANYF